MGLFDVSEKLYKTQCCLQEIASVVATPSSSATSRQQDIVTFDPEFVKEIDGWVDVYADRIPPLDKFIIPGGVDASCALHISRSVCRRTERTLSAVSTDVNIIPKECSSFVNRLSDLLFVLARYTNWISDVSDESFKKPRPPRCRDASD